MSPPRQVDLLGIAARGSEMPGAATSDIFPGYTCDVSTFGIHFKGIRFSSRGKSKNEEGNTVQTGNTVRIRRRIYPTEGN